MLFPAGAVWAVDGLFPVTWLQVLERQSTDITSGVDPNPYCPDCAVSSVVLFLFSNCSDEIIFRFLTSLWCASQRLVIRCWGLFFADTV